jgi:hypothetical protein
MPAWGSMSAWRNRQTRQLEVLVPATGAAGSSPAVDTFVQVARYSL